MYWPSLLFGEASCAVWLAVVAPVSVELPVQVRAEEVGLGRVVPVGDGPRLGPVVGRRGERRDGRREQQHGRRERDETDPRRQPCRERVQGPALELPRELERLRRRDLCRSGRRLARLRGTRDQFEVRWVRIGVLFLFLFLFLLIVGDSETGQQQAEDEEGELEPRTRGEPDERQAHPANEQPAEAAHLVERDGDAVRRLVGVALGLQGAVVVDLDHAVGLDLARTTRVVERGDVSEELLRILLGRGQDDVADLDPRLHRAALDDVRPPAEQEGHEGDEQAAHQEPQPDPCDDPERQAQAMVARTGFGRGGGSGVDRTDSNT